MDGHSVSVLRAPVETRPHTIVYHPPCGKTGRGLPRAKGIDEDPGAGGAHCALAPFWTAWLGKPEIRAFQASARGGKMVFYMESEAEV